jgi:hypothetical protein
MPTVVAIASGVAGVLALAWLAGLFAGRATFALDLEWMEGGVLVHAQRLAAGQGIYVPPSLDFIPFLYTPLYPALLALLSKLLGLGYALGRVVSIVAFAAACGLVVFSSVASTPREATRPLGRAGAAGLGFAGAGVVAAGFVFTGTFYDLVRGDSLALMLQALALVLAYHGRSRRSAALAGVVIALAFFTKQTASLVGMAIGTGLLVCHWRRGLIYGLAASVVLGVGMLLLQSTSDGWFWTYVFDLHQSHAFNKDLAWKLAPQRLWAFGWPIATALVAATAAACTVGCFQRRDVILLLTAAAGVFAALVGFGTQWAFDNAYIPAVYFPVLAASTLAARVLCGGAASPRRTVAGVLVTAVGLTLAFRAVKDGVPDASVWVPSRTDRQVADRFLAIVRAQPGDGFIPFHPFYATLAGKRPFVHRMGVWDVAARFGRPRGLDEALRDRTFAFILLDWKSRPGEWPFVDSGYHVTHVFRDGVDAVRSFSGAETSPRYLLVPTRAAPATPDGGRVLADFDDGSWGVFTAEGEAFGAAPVPAGAVGFGAGIADSGRDGDETAGLLRSAPFASPHGELTFTLSGPADPALRVLLLDGPATLAETSPDGGTRQVNWTVPGARGREVVLVIEDRSPTGALIVDHIVIR